MVYQGKIELYFGRGGGLFSDRLPQGKRQSNVHGRIYSVSENRLPPRTGQELTKYAFALGGLPPDSISVIS